MLWLMLAALAGAADSSIELEPTSEVASAVRIVKKERRTKVPPLRTDFRAALRPGMSPGSVVEVGTQIARTHKTLFDLNVAYTGGHALLIPGPPRSYLGLEVSGDALYSFNRFFAVGPTAAVAWRQFRQQNALIDQSVVPVAGVKLSAAVISTRKWSLALSSRWTVDGGLTRMILETSEVRHLHPIEGQVGLKLNFGHGQPPAPR